MRYNIHTLCIIFSFLFICLNTLSACNQKEPKSQDNIDIELLESYWDRGNLLFENGDYEKAIIAYNKTIDTYYKLSESERENYFSPLELVYENKAEVLVELERYEEAIECYDKQIELTPDEFPTLNTIYFDKIFALYKLGRYDEAINCCDIAIDKIRKRGSSTWHIDGFYHYKGNLYEAKGKEFYNEAKACYEKALEIEPDNVQIKEELEQLLLKME